MNKKWFQQLVILNFFLCAAPLAAGAPEETHRTLQAVMEASGTGGLDAHFSILRPARGISGSQDNSIAASLPSLPQQTQTQPEKQTPQKKENPGDDLGVSPSWKDWLIALGIVGLGVGGLALFTLAISRWLQIAGIGMVAFAGSVLLKDI